VPSGVGSSGVPNNPETPPKGPGPAIRRRPGPLRSDMKFHRSLTAMLVAGATALTLAACGDDGEGTEKSSTTTKTSASEVAAFPTAMELNGILARATDPNVPVGEKAATVDSGEEATELFDVM